MKLADLQALIAAGESEVLEFKERFNTDVIETFVALANICGGRVVIGVTGMTVENLLGPEHASKPRNKLIAQVFYDLGLIERYGSGIRRILESCRATHQPEPVFENYSGEFRIKFTPTARTTEQVVTPEKREVSQPESQPESMSGRVIKLLESEALSKQDISRRLGQKEISGALNKSMRYLREAGFVELTIPDKPNSRLQKYRLKKPTTY